jgi:hypothetical protein
MRVVEASVVRAWPKGDIFCFHDSSVGTQSVAQSAEPCRDRRDFSCPGGTKASFGG